MKGDQMSIMRKPEDKKGKRKRPFFPRSKDSVTWTRAVCSHWLGCHPIYWGWSWCLYFFFQAGARVGYKRERWAFPSVTINQKENRIPLQPLLCKLWCLCFSFPEEFILSLDYVEKCVEQCHCVAASFEPLALTPHLYVSDNFYVGVCFLISWPLSIITEVSILSKLLLGFPLCPGKNFWLTLWHKSEKCQMDDFGLILPVHSFVLNHPFDTCSGHVTWQWPHDLHIYLLA